MKIHPIFTFTLLAAASAHAAAPHYTLIPLQDLGGGFSQANAINASGQTTGFSDDGASPSLRHAVRWDSDCKIGGDLGQFGTGDEAVGNGIDDTGKVVGSSFTMGHGAKRAILALAGGTMVTLGSFTAATAPAANKVDFLSGDSESQAFGINNSGKVVGYSSATGDLRHAFSWTAGNGMVGLSPFLGDQYSSAAAVNDDGVIVGISYLTSSLEVGKAVRWLPGSHGTYSPASSLGTLGGSFSEAVAINRVGQIVGYSSTAGEASYRAFLYDDTATPKMRELGNFPATGGPQSFARGINDSGQVVGYAIYGDSDLRAFLYTAGTLYEFDELVPNSGWTDTEATGINAAGEIVGYGTAPDGAQRGFLLRPLKPGLPYARLAAPVVKISGAKKVTTAKAKLTIKGKATGQVTSVTAKVGRKTAKAKGTTSWSLKAALKPGKNKITVTAHGPGGDSAPAKLTIIRK